MAPRVREDNLLFFISFNPNSLSKQKKERGRDGMLFCTRLQCTYTVLCYTQCCNPRYYSTLYRAALCHPALHYTVPYYATPFYTAQCCSTLHRSTLHGVAPHYTVLHYSTRHGAVLRYHHFLCTIHSILYCAVLYPALLYHTGVSPIILSQDLVPEFFLGSIFKYDSYFSSDNVHYYINSHFTRTCVITCLI